MSRWERDLSRERSCGLVDALAEGVRGVIKLVSDVGGGRG